MRLTPLLGIALASLTTSMVPIARGQFDDPNAAPTPPPTSASSEIRDPAALFGRDAVREALARLVNIERTYRIPVTIETVESLKGESIDEATLRMSRRLGPQAKGLYALISKGDHKMEVIASRDNAALNARARRIAIRDAFLEEFRKNNYDLGLRRGVESIERTLALLRAEGSPGVFVPLPTPTTTAGPTSADRAGLVRRNGVKLTLAGAKRVLAAAEAKAGDLGHKMNIAVVDDGGHLLAFSRMDDARPASANTALTKAITAATYRAPTGPLPGKGTADNPDVLLNLSLQNAAASSGGKITTLLGGIPIVVGGQVIGAIGIGGALGEQDAEVARAAVAQFLAEFEASPSPPK